MSKLYSALPCEEAPRPSRCHGHCYEEALCGLCAAIAAKKHCLNSALLLPLLRRSTVWAALPCEEAPRTPHCYGHCCEEAPRTPHMITAARTCTSIAAEEVLCGSHRCRPACVSHPPLAQGGCIDEHDHSCKHLHNRRCRRSTVWQSPVQACMCVTSSSNTGWLH